MGDLEGFIKELQKLCDVFGVRLQGETFVSDDAGYVGFLNTNSDGFIKLSPDSRYDVIVTDPGEKKISLIKALRSAKALSLREAKEIADEMYENSKPTSMDLHLRRAEADDVVERLRLAGARASIVPNSVTPAQIDHAVESLQAIATLEED